MATFKHLPTDSLTRPGLALVKGGYRFSYDKCNRLTDAEYSENDSHEECQNYYDEPIQKYDANGNIEHLQRRGRKQDGHVGKIDNLSIFHHGNQLSSVVDDAAKIYYAGIFNFNGDGKNEAHYKYNDSGSLIEDTGRGITNIEYDNWNNPKRIQFANGNVTKYVYSADGEKLRTVHYTAVPNITVAAGQTHELSKDEILSIDSTDYIGRLVLKNGKPDMYTFTGGYYAFAGTYPSLGTVGGLYFYNYDHLSNVREVVNEDGNLLQVNNYYPFGAPYSDNSVTAKNPGLQPYKYSGKELDLVHGLNTYDHGARQNYSVLGMWDRVDPMVEKYYNLSPYAVCGDNPILNADFDGRKLWVGTGQNAASTIDLIRGTLPESERKFVQVDKDGFIDQDILSSGVNNNSSENFNDLLMIVQDPRIVKYFGLAPGANMLYDVNNSANFIKEFVKFIPPTHGNSVEIAIKQALALDNTLKADVLRRLYISQGLEDSYQVTGNLGVTLRPNSEQGCYPNNSKRSLSNYIEVYTSNVGTTKLDQYVNAGHELYNHVLFYLLGLNPTHYNEDLNAHEKQVMNDIYKYNQDLLEIDKIRFK